MNLDKFFRLVIPYVYADLLVMTKTTVANIGRLFCFPKFNQLVYVQLQIVTDKALFIDGMTDMRGCLRQVESACPEDGETSIHY